MVLRHRNFLDLGAALAVAVLTTVGVLAVQHDGVVPVVWVAPVVLLGMVAVKLMGATLEVDDDAVVERRPTRLTRLDLDAIDRFVILDARGRLETRARGPWVLAAVRTDGELVRIPTVRGLRASTAGWFPPRTRLFAEELCMWHDVRRQLRVRGVVRPSLRLVSGD